MKKLKRVPHFWTPVSTISTHDKPEGDNAKEEFLQNLQFKYLKLTEHDQQYIATLVDTKGCEILKGYGTSYLEAIDDLHSNLI